MEIIIFTDGSFIKKNNLAYAGYGIHFPNKEFKDISEPFLIKPYTNQRAELYAIYMAIKMVTEVGRYDKIKIYTDSEYSINSLTKWIHNWVKNNWKTANRKPVKNKDIIKKIYEYITMYKSRLIFIHVRSHTKSKDPLSVGNSIADSLAVLGAKKAKNIIQCVGNKCSGGSYIRIGKHKKRTKLTHDELI